MVSFIFALLLMLLAPLYVFVGVFMAFNFCLVCTFNFNENFKRLVNVRRHNLLPFVAGKGIRFGAAMCTEFGFSFFFCVVQQILSRLSFGWLVFGLCGAAVAALAYFANYLFLTFSFNCLYNWVVHLFCGFTGWSGFFLIKCIEFCQDCSLTCFTFKRSKISLMCIWLK